MTILDVMKAIVGGVLWISLVFWSVRFCKRKGYPFAAALSIFFPYMTVPIVAMLGDSPRKMRYDAVARGVDPARWVPTFVNMKPESPGGTLLMNHSFAVATPDAILFYRCQRDLYRARNVADPFRYAERYVGDLPISAVRHVHVIARAADDVSRSRQNAFWKDLLYNKTVGGLFGVSNKTVTMAAFVVLDVSDPGKAVLFGIPHGGDTGGGAGFIGDLLPGKLGTAFEVAELTMGYADCDEPDARAGINAEAVARGLIGLMNRAPAPALREAALVAG
jgi:hypothetical protein